MTSLAASVAELESPVSLASLASLVALASLVSLVSRVTGVSLVTPRSVLGYQRCSSRPFSGWRSVWSEGRLRLKNPHL